MIYKKQRGKNRYRMQSQSEHQTKILRVICLYSDVDMTFLRVYSVTSEHNFILINFLFNGLFQIHYPLLTEFNKMTDFSKIILTR